MLCSAYINLLTLIIRTFVPTILILKSPRPAGLISTHLLYSDSDVSALVPGRLLKNNFLASQSTKDSLDVHTSRQGVYTQRGILANTSAIGIISLDGVFIRVFRKPESLWVE